MHGAACRTGPRDGIGLSPGTGGASSKYGPLNSSCCCATPCASSAVGGTRKKIYIRFGVTHMLYYTALIYCKERCMPREVVSRCAQNLVAAPFVACAEICTAGNLKTTKVPPR